MPSSQEGMKVSDAVVEAGAEMAYELNRLGRYPWPKWADSGHAGRGNTFWHKEARLVLQAAIPHLLAEVREALAKLERWETRLREHRPSRELTAGYERKERGHFVKYADVLAAVDSITERSTDA